MFGKLLVTVTVVAVIWFGFQYLQRMAELKELLRLHRTRAGGRTGVRPPPSSTVQDLVKCPACGTWVAGATARPCGRPGCPY